MSSLLVLLHFIFWNYFTLLQEVCAPELSTGSLIHKWSDWAHKCQFIHASVQVVSGKASLGHWFESVPVHVGQTSPGRYLGMHP